MNAQPNIANSPAARAAGAFFRWEIPGESLGVNLHLNIIELMERDALRAGRKYAAGVLLGRFDRARELTMTIEHYAAATPERGAVDCPFGDSERVRLMLDRWRPGKSRMSIIGLYRTCADQEAVLNEDDLIAIRASVGPGNDPETIIPQTGGAESTGRRVPSVAESAALPASQTAAGAGSDTSRLPRNGESLSPATIEEPDRVFILIEPRSDRISKAVLYLARDGEVVYQSPAIAFNRGEISKMAAADPPRTSQAARPSNIPQDVFIRDTEGAEETGWKLPKLLPYFNNFYRLLAAAAVLVLLIAGYLQLRNDSGPSAPSTLTADGSDSSTNSDLGLKLERLGTDWRLKWDTTSPVFLKATSGHLEITDGTLHKNVNLDESDLRGGNIVYSPLSNNVVLRLEIESADSPGPVSESVRILGGLPSQLSPSGTSDVPPLPDAQIVPPGLDPSLDSAPAPVTAQTQAAGGLLPPNALPAETSKRQGIDLSEARSISQPSTRQIDQPASRRSAQLPAGGLDQPVAARRVNRTPARHIDQPPAREDLRPSVVKSEPVNTSPMAALRVTGAEPSVNPSEAQPALAPIMARTLPEAASPMPVLDTVRKGGIVQPAQLISHVDPVYPPQARQQGVSGSVEVRFNIGANGDVSNVTVVKGPSVLGQAAIDAVRARKYKPARVNGVPTETSASAVFDFKLN